MGQSVTKEDGGNLLSPGLQSSSRHANGASYKASEMPHGSTGLSVRNVDAAAKRWDCRPVHKVQSAHNLSAVERHLPPNISAGSPAREPRIVFGNMSSFIVSFWVLQEHKTQTTKIHHEVVTMVNARLNAGADISLAGNTGRRNEKTVHNNVASCFIMTHSRIGPSAGLLGTHLNFPRNCTDLRVFGFFQMPGNGLWKRFRNKVYSIDRGKKIFTVAPSDSNIHLYIHTCN